MKKNGFTLAEVLITLGIIGVVAALTLPNLNFGVQASRVGPSLRKFINTMENANELILEENSSATLRSVLSVNGGANNNNLPDQTTAYLNQIASVVRGTQNSNSNQLSIYDNSDLKIKNYGGDTNGTYRGYYIFNFDSGESMGISLRLPANNNRGTARGAHRGIFADVLFDINGFNTRPNQLGIDLFLFRMDNNGSMIPAGGQTEVSAGYLQQTLNNPGNTWQANNNSGCNAVSVGTGETCAGSVADNNWRVIYKY